MCAVVNFTAFRWDTTLVNWSFIKTSTGVVVITERSGSRAPSLWSDPPIGPLRVESVSARVLCGHRLSPRRRTSVVRYEQDIADRSPPPSVVFHDNAASNLVMVRPEDNGWVLDRDGPVGSADADVAFTPTSTDLLVAYIDFGDASSNSRSLKGVHGNLKSIAIRVLPQHVWWTWGWWRGLAHRDRYP